MAGEKRLSPRDVHEAIELPFGFRAPRILTATLLAALPTESLGPIKKARLMVSTHRLRMSQTLKMLSAKEVERMPKKGWMTMLRASARPSMRMVVRCLRLSPGARISMLCFKMTGDASGGAAAEWVSTS
jgi:hypothetical protein